MDHQSRPRVRTKKSARDRLIRLAASHPTWVLGFQDEVWWSRLARPSLHAWIEEDDRMRLVEQAVAKDDPDPKALACSGLLLRADPTEQVSGETIRQAILHLGVRWTRAKQWITSPDPEYARKKVNATA